MIFSKISGRAAAAVSFACPFATALSVPHFAFVSFISAISKNLLLLALGWLTEES
jgi:membrane protein DedA with SNARE-associated domain